MPAELEIIPHPTGPWLVRAGDILYSVPPAVGRALRPLTGRVPCHGELRRCLTGVRPDLESGGAAAEIDRWAGELIRSVAPESPDRASWSGRRSAGRTIWPRIPLVPAETVRIIARTLAPLAGNRGLTALVLAGCTGYLAAAAGTGPIAFSPDLGNMIGGLGLLLLSAVWHELGHAAAVARSGYPPGGIGAGFLFVIPVLFADVTAIGLLPRGERVRVDAAGVIFQLSVGGVFTGLSGIGAFPPLLGASLAMAGASAMLAVAWSLFPFIRSDGYWLLCDLLGLDGLDRPPGKPVTNGLRWFLVVYQLLNAIFLILMGLYFPWRMIGLLLGLARHLGLPPGQGAEKWLTAFLVLAFLGMMGIGATRRAGILLRSAWTVATAPPPELSRTTPSGFNSL